MRVSLIATPFTFILAIAACGHDERRPPSGPATPKESSPPAQPAPAVQYVVADHSNVHNAIIMQLGGRGAEGVVVDKRRVIVGRGEPRIAGDAPTEPLIGAEKVPGRFGSGFLFWTSHALYRAESFDSKLVPVTRVPDAIERVAFGPKSIVVRTHNGERWGFGFPKADRASIGPLGVVDVGALDDGRAIAMSDQGAVFTSVDHGAHWIDATTQVKSSPSKVVILGQDVWLVESNNSASRLDADGHLSWFDKAPAEEAVQRRLKDPRWRGNDTPLHVAFRSGAAVDDSTAIVVDSGDLYRVDVHTGEILSAVPAQLPPDAQCEGIPIFGDVLFACVSPRSPGGAFVVSHTLTSEPPTVEQTFGDGGQFFASDDGGLAYSASCQGVAPNPASTHVVCVRSPGGRWDERDLSGLFLVTDGGTTDINLARWVPRADGRVVAILSEPLPGIYDPQLASFQMLPEEAHDLTAGRIGGSGKSGRAYRPSKRGVSFGNGIVDTSWSFVGSALRAWQRHGESFEITEDGRFKRSPYAFETTFAGPNGLGRSKDGRLYQSNDHGASWNEVAPPPSGEALQLLSCTSAGCDLGAFYRVGWAFRSPQNEPAPTPAPAPSEVRRSRGLELSCRPKGSVVAKGLSHTGDSPEDLGLGATRLPVPSEKHDWSYIRNPVVRSIVSPIHDASSGDSDAASLRAMFSGFGTTRDGGDVISVSGPNKSAAALRRGFAYVAPLDPAGRIVSTGIAMSDVVAAGRRAGMTTEEILGEDFTENGVVIPLTPSDPGAASDVVVHNVDHGLIALMRGERVRVAIRAPQNSTSVISGVNLTGSTDEAAFLEIDSSGVGHVFKVGSGGVADLFDVSPTMNESFYPANPDALAIGPKNELAVIRTPSGSDPPSAIDPALLLVQAMSPVALAPWSEVKLADDPACKAEPGGYRATLQLIAPWIRVTTPELKVEDGPMLARVRWTPKRVCLEAFEVRLPPVSMRSSGSPEANLATWLVAKGSTFARVGVADGTEWRQSLECNVAGPAFGGSPPTVAKSPVAPAP